MRPDFNFKTLSVALLPTPVQYLDALSRELDVEFYIKRDDLTGMELSGNKIRKLDFLFAQAIDQKATAIITCGGIQSNHARATAVLCRKLGLKPCLVLREGDGKNSPQGNLLLDHLLDARIIWITAEQYRDQRGEIMDDWALKLSQEGEAPFIIPEGGSNALGYMGYYQAALEIDRQSKEMNLSFDYLVTAIGSGGTFGGLWFANKLHHFSWELLGVNVCDTAEYFKSRIIGVLSELDVAYDLGLPLEPNELAIIDGFVGPGYAVSTVEDRFLIHKMARLHGIFLDPVYTGKAFHALVSSIESGRIPKKSKILFVHTGGLFGLFPQNHTFQTELKI